LSLSEFLKSVVRILDEADVPYMLTGSLAAAYYATPRATRDVDVVVHSAGGPGIDRIVDGLLKAGYYVDREAAREAWEIRGQFNAIDPSRGWKADLIVRKDRAFSVEEFTRRQRASMLGVEIVLASLEDVLLAKLEWSQLGDSELQRHDAVQLVERSWDRLDRTYLARWIKELGLEAEWATVLKRASVASREDDGVE
jgi:hypothetical protein